jgi:hypothetical protein
MPEITGAEAERMYADAFPETIAVANHADGGTPDRYGTPAESSPSSTNVGALLVALDATEDELARDTRVSRYSVFTRPDAPVTGASRISWRGMSLEVVGEPLQTSAEGIRRLTFTAREVKG